MQLAKGPCCEGVLRELDQILVPKVHDAKACLVNCPDSSAKGPCCKVVLRELAKVPVPKVLAAKSYFVNWPRFQCQSVAQTVKAKRSRRPTLPQDSIGDRDVWPITSRFRHLGNPNLLVLD
ncbi:hypothetical protein J6590_051381 [Homalodisca vitripennis]|nr:hypothetical protein J6590_051381 [Homalodisca vitripennis]